MDFSYPVSSIFFADSNNNISTFNRTLKNKDVNVKISRKITKINRNYNYKEKIIAGKQMVSSSFSIMCDFNTFKNLFGYENEVSTLENIRVGFINGKKLEKLEMYNCNITISADINYKYDKESTVTFKIEAQGEKGLYFDLLYGRTNGQIKELGFKNIDLKKYTNWEIKYMNELNR